MKTNIFLICIGFIYLFSSCESFLEEDSRGRLDESYLASESGLESLLIALYERAHHQVYTLMHLGAAGSDEITYAQENTARNMTLYADGLPSTTVVQNSWEYLYEMLNNVNFGLVTAQELDWSSESARQKVEGELYFFRAWLFWTAVELWGEGAHYQTEPTTSVIEEGYQTTIDVWYKTILSDLDEAYARLSETATLPGVVTLGTAKAMKARALMSLTQYDDAVIASTGYYGNQREVYQAAKAVADDLINNSIYKLEDDYEYLFDTNNQNNDEVIWALQMTLDDTYALSLHIMAREFTANPIYSLRENAFIPQYATGEGLYEHSGWYGRKMGTYMATYYYATLFDEEDLRLEGTFETVYQALIDQTTGEYSDMGKPFNLDGTPSDTIVWRPMRVVSDEEAKYHFDRAGIYVDGLQLIYTGPNNAPGGTAIRSNQRMYCNTIKKYLDRNRTAPKHEKSGNHLIIFRLGEQYLIAGECAYFLEGGAAAKPYFDKLRERARLKPTSLPIEANEIDLDWILDERTREMGTELVRWFDLKRTNKWDRVLKHNPDCEYFNPEMHKLRPVPNAELERLLNYPSGFKQNPGYPALTD